MNTTIIQPWTNCSPHLTGAFAPVFDERDDFNLPVEGEIPRVLNGVFMRNGPNPQFEPTSYEYPYDGTGMIHAVYFENGSARYRNRWVLTRELLEERAAGRSLFGSTFGGGPRANLVNTNIIRHGGRYMALYEGGVPYELDRELETAGQYNYHGRLPRAMSAHPKIDPETGELVAVAYDPETSQLEYLAADCKGALNKIVTFESPWPAMIHDVAVTRNYVVLFVCPFVLELRSPAGGLCLARLSA